MFDNLPLMLAQEDLAPPPRQAPAPPGGELQPLPGQEGQTEGETQAPTNNPFGGPFFFILIAMVALMFIMSWRTQSKEKKKRAEMLSALKKGDRVQTVGGVIGSVVEVRDTDVLLKVDENANTRIRFTRAAIQSIVNDAKAS